MNSKNRQNEVNVDDSWSIFLDRDGVINTRKIGGYIQSIDEFEFTPGALKSIIELGKIFKYIFIVTNQQGIGKGLFSVEQLAEVHEHMTKTINKAGGRITKIYFCPNLASDNSRNRKPNTGMGIQAKLDFPEVDFHKSIMIGDSPSDMQFGERLGMKCIGIGKRVQKEDGIWKYFETLADVDISKF